MAKKEFKFHGKTLEEVKELSLDEFAGLIPSKQRRKLTKGFTDAEKILMEKIKAKRKNIETHCRTMIIIPEMIDQGIKVHNGKEFVLVQIVPEMLGHRLGEFSLTRKRVSHSSPGVGATRSSSAISVR